jgi:hypothetical protein
MHDDTPMDLGAVPETRYVRTEDGVHIGYQVFGDGPYDFVLNDGWMSNVDANWDVAGSLLLRRSRGGARDHVRLAAGSRCQTGRARPGHDPR